MKEILRYLKSYEVWIYAVLGLGLLLSLRHILLALHEWRISVFGLEKETAQRRLGGALPIFVFLCVLAIAELVMTSVVFPDFPDVQSLATPTVDLLSTPTETLAPVLLPTATEVGIPTIEVSNSSDGCVAGQIDWSSPKDGDTLQGVVTLEGTVSIPNMGFYKYEYSQSGTDIWVPIAAATTGVVDGPLGGPGSGTWDTSQLTPGDYLLRLVVTDNVNNVFSPCVISVRIIAPEEN